MIFKKISAIIIIEDKKEVHKMLITIFIGLGIDFAVFFALCKSASKADKIIEKAWENSINDEWEDI